MMSDLQKIKITVLFLFAVQYSFACDICSCGAANSNSFSGNLAGNYVGFAYNFIHFKFKENSVVNDSPLADDYINTATISGQYMITEKIQINAMIPYRLNDRTTSTVSVSNHGIGDITLYGMIGLFPEESKHNLKIGVGAKLPTGEFNLQRASDNQTSATQLGTGSLDVLLPLQYRFKKEDLAFNINASYFIKTENNDRFKYGNQTQINTSISYAFELNEEKSLVPNLGISYDHFLPTEQFGIKDETTSGYMTNANIGLEASLKQFIIGANYQIPIRQNIIEGDVSFERGLGLYTYWRF